MVEIEEIETQDLEEMIDQAEEIQAEETEVQDKAMIALKEKEFLLKTNSKKVFNYLVLPDKFVGLVASVVTYASGLISDTIFNTCLTFFLGVTHQAMLTSPSRP